VSDAPQSRMLSAGWRLVQTVTTEGDYLDETDRAGFYSWLQKYQFDPQIREVLPRAWDRLSEAWFFVELLASLKPCDANRDAANWSLGAHISAYIGIDHAAKHDFASLGVDYAGTPLQREFWLRSNDSDPYWCDPLGVNRLYRDLRNIRVHTGETLVHIDDRKQKSDIAMKRDGLPRWYLRGLNTLRLDRLFRPQLSELEIHKINNFLKHEMLITFLSRNVAVMAMTVRETASKIRVPG
jgi:hypothetical protein